MGATRLIFFYPLSIKLSLQLKGWKGISFYYTGNISKGSDGRDVTPIPFMANSAQMSLNDRKLHITWKFGIRDNYEEDNSETLLEIATHQVAKGPLEFSNGSFSRLFEKLKKIYKTKIYEGNIKLTGDIEPFSIFTESVSDNPDVFLINAPVRSRIWLSKDPSFFGQVITLGPVDIEGYKANSSVPSPFCLYIEGEGFYLRLLSASRVAFYLRSESPIRIELPGKVTLEVFEKAIKESNLDDVVKAQSEVKGNEERPLDKKNEKTELKNELLRDFIRREFSRPILNPLIIFIGKDDASKEIALHSPVNFLQFPSTTTCYPGTQLGAPVFIGDFYTKAVEGELRLGVKDFLIKNGDELFIGGEAVRILKGNNNEINLEGESRYIILNKVSLSRTIWTSLSSAIQAALIGGLFSITVVLIGWHISKRDTKKVK